MVYLSFFKPLLDFSVAFIVIILFFPLFIIIPFFIVIDSGYPIVFRQKRVGKNKKEFYIYKFRTMVNGAEQLGGMTKKNDNRVTRVGKYLRMMSLDEVPQIFNILKGDMSLVGFRPGLYSHYKKSDFDKNLFSVKPGITGLAQVYGRSSLTPEKKRELEVEYARKVCFILDLKIILLTFFKVLKKSSVN
ncbi:sugar transferase [Pseudoalteromonas maricaloris]|uniref:Sugar transferase n=1 Tax=Pseudoalteromonas maricaloris TaxID=184924 RepID=A0A8I2HD57_9GAMM|nr:sugar transferase [Pseudoalteromonas maricaloris]NLR23400.1 sugar transferase [Pseudoalteromonas maricaloris]WOX29220.1 sugar transferase [Pseudoalteromonas maricaloris]